MKNLPPFVVSAVVGIALSAGAHAATLTVSDTFGLATTNWTHLLGARQFDSALGTLGSATFEFSNEVVQHFKAENLAANADTIAPVVGAQFRLRKSAATVFTTRLDRVGTAFDATAFDATHDFAGTSGIDFGDIAVTANGTITLAGAALADLTGTGTLGSAGYDIVFMGGGSFTSISNLLNERISTHGRYNLMVTYDYAPLLINSVPEPGSMALFVVAMGGWLTFTCRRPKV